uniref:Uncharacterized protein n=1 Tax=Phlebotomus papatasi TaxID=29031 RepID=A0A1B0DRJ1_PHLPP
MSTILDLDSHRVYDTRAFSSTPSPLSNSSTSDGSEATYNYQGSQGSNIGQLSYNMNQMLHLNTAQPHLVIIHEPMDKFRFRYKSEMHGSHGSLMASTKDKSKKHYPRVELRGYDGEAIIRCSLYQEDTERPMPHSHKLVVRNGDEDREDPHDVIVSPTIGFHAEFRGMGIIHTAKKNIAEELFKKLKTTGEAERGEDLTAREEAQLREKAIKEEKNMNLNTVRLCFQCFVKDASGQLRELCKPVYSQAINNMKSALTGELKISRMSCAVSSVNGGDDVFLFVEKVNKKNIKVRFFKEDEYENVVWQAYGNFTEIDVHHQYGIALTTPEYYKKDIKTQVDVRIQLERPSDGEKSESLPFTYKPCLEAMAPRKRARPNESFNSSDIPLTVNQMDVGPRISEEFNTTEQLNDILKNADENILPEISAEFLKHIEMNSDEYKEMMDYDSSHLIMSDWTPTSGPLLCRDSPSTGASSKGRMDVFTEKVSNTSCNNLKDNEAIYKKILQLVSTYGASVPIKVEHIVNHLLTESKKTGENLLHWAIREDDGRVKNILDIVYKFNLNEYLDTVNEKGENCLHLACVMDKAEYIKPLINLGANPNTWDCNGNTPLHVAVAEGRQMCIARIVDQSHYTPKSKPLDINLANDQGMTALHLAVKNHNLEAVKRLVEAGASVKIAERKHGNSILHIAVAERAVDIVRFLLQKTKVDVNQMTSSGYTPLHLACVSTETADSKEIVRLLLEHKADPMKANDSRVHQFSNLGKAEIKKEIVDMEPEVVGIPPLFDDICLRQLCDIFNANDLWKQLAIILDQSSRISVFEKSANPTKTLLNVIVEIQDSSLEDLMSAFKYLRVDNAIACVQQMMMRKNVTGTTIKIE